MNGNKISLSESPKKGKLSEIEESEYPCVDDIIEEIKEQHKRNGNVPTTTCSEHFAKMCNELEELLFGTEN